jgi:hypothetical protein
MNLFISLFGEKLMSLESKRVVVTPSMETVAIDTERAFGWSLKDRNEVMNSHEVFDGAYSYSYNGISSGVVNTHTESNHFVSLLFERDKANPYHAEFVRLENEYNEAIQSYNQAQKKAQEKNAGLIKKRQELLDGKSLHTKWKEYVVFGVILVVVYFIVCICVANSTKEPYIWASMLPDLLFAGILIGVGVDYRNKALNPNPINAQIASLDKQIQANSEGDAEDRERISDCLKKGSALVDQMSQESKQELPASDPMSALESLKKLHEQGIITDKEYKTKKASLLSKI